MSRDRETTSKLDMIDAQLCALLEQRRQLAGENPAPDRRRLSAARKIEQRFGHAVAAAYKAVLRGMDAADAEDGLADKISGAGTRIIDITRELLSAELYPGDPAPLMEPVVRIADGDDCNVSRLTLGTHTGTHADAPLHFIDGAEDITAVDPEKYIGACDVVEWESFGSGKIPADCRRLLIRNARELTEEQAGLIADSDIVLVGVDRTSVGGEAVHKLLLGKGIVLAESLEIGEIPDGEYTLICAPLKIAGADGAPCRAFLIK